VVAVDRDDREVALELRVGAPQAPSEVAVVVALDQVGHDLASVSDVKCALRWRATLSSR
jgi:hypothetical protein